MTILHLIILLVVLLSIIFVIKLVFTKLKDTPKGILAVGLINLFIELILLILLLTNYNDVATSIGNNVATTFLLFVLGVIGTIGLLKMRKWGMFLFVGVFLARIILLLIDSNMRLYMKEFNYFPILFFSTLIAVVIYNYKHFKDKK